ncbi:sugar transferase [Sphingomonas sp. IW22]|jgi:lipopolysaccharide/colanic/teichoic acid biosynthesis glycosyltransferase|uniref:sugar transferase n=1 Tax=Sphingomonas sp. IW22 TaxID=3242489 RepID=UPI00352018B8
MLVSTQKSRQNRAALFRRLRFQLPVLWGVSVGIPALLVFSGILTVDTYRAAINSAIASGLAGLFGLLAVRRVDSFPGVRSYAFILPALAAAFGLALVLTFGLRLAYSRSIFLGSFSLSVLLVPVLVYVSERTNRLCFYTVPGGDADALHDIRGAEWIRMDEPTMPPFPAMLVADFRHDHDDVWERLLATAAISGRVVYHSKLLRESLTGRVTIQHLSENSFGSLVPNLAYRKIKRVVDIAACIVLVPVLILPMLAIAAAIRMDSKGPVLFKQERMGFRGQVFQMVKFRTMRDRLVEDSDAAARHDAMTRTDDARITRPGRFLRRTRLDELPQILNILRGEMSWIGPRPEAVPLSQWYEQEIPFYSYRHIIRPGISGWAQVHQGHVTDLDAINEKLAYDFYYVKYFSAWLDMVIAFRTIPTMIGGFGAK